MLTAGSFGKLRLVIHCSVSVFVGILVVFANQLKFVDITHSEDPVTVPRFSD
jgi:hypothetical protein